jgi:translation initiation factor 4G
LIPPPQTLSPAIHKTENRYEVGNFSDEEQAKQRKIKSILNKLTPQNFDRLLYRSKK